MEVTGLCSFMMEVLLIARMQVRHNFRVFPILQMDLRSQIKGMPQQSLVSLVVVKVWIILLIQEIMQVADRSKLILRHLMHRQVVRLLLHNQLLRQQM